MRSLHDTNAFRRAARSSRRGHPETRNAPDHFTLIIDDTDNPKWGKNFLHTSSWGGSKGTYRGQKILVLALADIRRRIAVPIAYDIVEKADKKKSKNAPTILDRAIDLLKTAKKEGYGGLSVVVDSWFDSVAFIRDVEDLGFVFYGELKSRRRVRHETSARGNPWQKLSGIFTGFYRSSHGRHWRKVSDKRQEKKIWIAEAHLVIRKRKAALRVIAAYPRKGAKTPIGYYATTDRSAPGAKVWLMSRVRWGIECIFRTTKQNLSFGQARSGGEAASHLAVVLPLLLYNEFYMHGETSTRSEESTKMASVDLEVARLRAAMAQRSLDVMLAQRHPPIVDRLRARLSKDTASRKPRNRIVGEEKAA